MSNISTFDYLSFEEEASYWLTVFDELPDSSFRSSDNIPNAFLINKVKAFARSYKSVNLLGVEHGIIIN